MVQVKPKANVFKEGLGASQIAERALATVQDSSYRKALKRQLRHAGVAVLIAVLGLGVSIWQLFHNEATLSDLRAQAELRSLAEEKNQWLPEIEVLLQSKEASLDRPREEISKLKSTKLTPFVVFDQASQFWLLCLVLAGGLLGVAFLSGAGLLTTNLAMERLAIARKDFDVFEATHQSEQMRSMVEAIYRLTQKINQEGSQELEVIGNSLSFMLEVQGREYQTSSEVKIQWKSILTQWRNMGVKDDELERLGAAI